MRKIFIIIIIFLLPSIFLLGQTELSIDVNKEYKDIVSISLDSNGIITGKITGMETDVYILHHRWNKYIVIDTIDTKEKDEVKFQSRLVYTKNPLAG